MLLLERSRIHAFMIVELVKNTSLVDKFISELRSVDKQKDRQRFRKNLFRMGQVFAYEISKQLEYKSTRVSTPLGEAVCEELNDEVVVASILRAGIPFHNGLLDFFDDADNAFIAAYRSHHKDGTFDISLEYSTSPSLEGKIVVLADPMLATGASIDQAIKTLSEYGQWKALYVVSIVASSQGVKHVQRLHKDAHIWVGAIDEELTAKSYIVPGLGDAGDLAFGSKS